MLSQLHLNRLFILHFVYACYSEFTKVNVKIKIVMEHRTNYTNHENNKLDHKYVTILRLYNTNYALRFSN